jgi:hypothetical protein
MSLAATTTAVVQRLQAIWTGPIEFSGDNSFVKPTDRVWVRPAVVPSITQAANVGATADETEGVVVLDVFAPRNRPGGPGMATSTAEQLAASFRCVTFSGVQCRIPTVRPVQSPPNDPYHHVKVVTEYRRVDWTAQEADMAAYLTETQTQAGHDFALAEAIRWTGTEWVRAIADAEAHLAQALVCALRDSSRFDVIYLGAGASVQVTSHGLGASGAVLFLSPTLPGAATTQRPAIAQGLCVVKDADHLIMSVPIAGEG